MPSFHNSIKLKAIREFSIVWNGSFVNRYQFFKPCATSTVRTAILKMEAEGYSKQWCISTIPYRQGAQLDELQQLHFRMQMRQNKYINKKNIFAFHVCSYFCLI